jgi:hypothetical protein
VHGNGHARRRTRSRDEPSLCLTREATMGDRRRTAPFHARAAARGADGADAYGRTRKQGTIEWRRDPDDRFPRKQLRGGRDPPRCAPGSPSMSPGAGVVDACSHAIALVRRLRSRRLRSWHCDSAAAGGCAITRSLLRSPTRSSPDRESARAARLGSSAPLASEGSPNGSPTRVATRRARPSFPQTAQTHHRLLSAPNTALS